MIVTKQIAVGVDIDNVFTLYASDTLLQILKNKYEHKCFKSSWIIEVVNVVKTGNCNINQFGKPGCGTIHVVFSARAIVFVPDEVLLDCKVNTKTSDGSIICSTDNCNILIKKHKSLESITPGQIIMVRVGAAIYRINADKVSVNGLPFTHLPDVWYKISTDGVTDDVSNSNNGNASNNDASNASNASNNGNSHIDALRELIDAAHALETECKKIKEKNNAAWDTFNNYMYAYKKPQKPTIVKKLFKFIDDVLDGSAGAGAGTGNSAGTYMYVCRSNMLDKSQPDIAYSDKPMPDAVDIGTVQALAILVNDYIEMLNMLKFMIATYSNAEIIRNHENLWRYLKSIKQDVA